MRLIGCRQLYAGLLWLLLAGCSSLPLQQRNAAVEMAHVARSERVDCTRSDACALESPLLALARVDAAASTQGVAHHHALILDDAPDALLARVHLIRSARHSIDLQTYIFDEDDAAQLILDELQAAAFRGVKVRVLVDQLAALRKLQTMAALAALHVNFQLRIYNPVLDRARLSLPMYAVAAACCWHRLNQRMHNKLLLVDDQIAIVGGRNYQDDYYDWGAQFNFRDRDLLLTGPATHAMAANFDAFWGSPRSVPAEQLGDVARYLHEHGPPPPPHHVYHKPARVRALLADVADAEVLRKRFVDPAMAVDNVYFIADSPSKHRSDADASPTPSLQRPAAASTTLRELIGSAHSEILLQTPYLVLSKPAQRMFRELHQRPQPPRVLVSTNSLASTDAFIAYAVSYKYKRRYLRDFGFEIHEFKPFPADAPFELGVTGAGLASFAEAQPQPRQVASESSRRSPFASSGKLPVRLKRAGMRMGLHAKSMVIDRRIGVIGTHNFDPRGDALNTESAVVIEDPAFAQALADSILRDMAPENAWTIGRRDPSPILPGIEYTLAKISEQMPIFDLWPIKYAVSYEYVPGPDCPPLQVPASPFSADFRRCHRPVGDFPEVDIGLKWLGVRLFTGFGSGLSPIL